MAVGAQHDLTLRMRTSSEMFYARSGRSSFHTTKTHSGHSSRFPTALQNAPDSAPDVVVWPAPELGRGRHEETRVHYAHRRRGGSVAVGGGRAAGRAGAANRRVDELGCK